MINADNYYSKTNSLDFSTLPPAMQKGHEYINKVTQSGADWNAYHQSPTIQKVIDGYFQKLSEHITEKPVKKQPEHRETKTFVKKEENPDVRREPEHKKENKHEHHAPAKPKESEDVDLVERIPDELRLMRRYVNLHGKKKTHEELLRFINAVQKAIIERRVTKSSPYASQVSYIQNALLKIYNTMKGRFAAIEINSKTYNEFKKIIEGERVYLSIQFIKRYVNLHGKIGVKEKAHNLMEQINRAFKNERIDNKDKYAKRVKDILASLKRFVGDKNQKTLPLNSAELNGLLGFLQECDCGETNGLGMVGDFESPVRENKIMSSMDFANMKFNCIGFTGKWQELIGDPAPGFTAMVYGKPKMGKSYLCVEFAGYLARNHGKVLYVAREEGLETTLQMKLNDKNVKHPNLFVSDFLPTDLSAYDFIFLDSVNKLGLTPQNLEMLCRSNHGKSFIFVFQTTKDGNFRGKNEFQHDVDVVIEVPQLGKAVQFGRYNQGGEMEIFD